jgi:hypothetical protein
MTSNMSVEEIHIKLDWMNKKDEKHIHITYSVGLKVEFLDVNIENCNGSLMTSVFHKPAAEPYVLPFVSNYPQHIHINIPYQALLRTSRLCSDVYVFDRERLEIEMILLLNGYLPRLIKRHFDRFFRLNQAMSVFMELDAKRFEKLHKKFLYLPTRREKKSSHQRTTSEKDSKQMYENSDIVEKKRWNKKILIISYTFESGPLLNFKRKFRQLWTKFYVYQGSSMNDVRLMITTLSNPSLNDLLVQKKPSRSLLTKMETLSSRSTDKEEELEKHL